jgi:hypothetical protein
MKLKLKAPGTKCLKLNSDILLSNSAFKINLRRYNVDRVRERPAGAHSRAVQVDPVKPTLKPPGIKRLKLKRDVQLSNVACKFS